MPIDKVYTVAEWARRWLELYKKDKCSANAYAQYEYIVSNYIIVNIGHLKLTAAKPAHIADTINKYRDMSGSHVKIVMMCIRGIFEMAVDNDLCAKNPAKNIRPELKKAKEREFFNEQELQIIEKFCLEERSNISDALMTLLYTGLRREELLGLKWADVKQGLKNILLNLREHHHFGFSNNSVISVNRQRISTRCSSCTTT